MVGLGSHLHVFMPEQGQVEMIYDGVIGVDGALNLGIVTDSMADPHVFFHRCDLGWNDYNYVSLDAETRSVKHAGELYFGHPIEYPVAYDLAVDEFNCVQFAYSFHSDFMLLNGLDTLKVEVLELCNCEYIESRNIITNQGGVLVSNLTELAEFQWLDCSNNNNPIPGATNQSYTPNTNGAYALEVTVNGCVDTTDCVEISGIGLFENSWNGNVSLYPNPASNSITVALALPEFVVVKIYDLHGKLLKVHEGEAASSTIDISNLSQGVYSIQVQFAQAVGNYKFVKQ